MRLIEDARIAPLHPFRALACILLLAACTTSPTSGRPQFNILPDALETTVPDLRFQVKTLIAAAGGGYCAEGENPCPARDAAELFARHLAPIAERLGGKAAELSPELTRRVPQVEVFVVPGDSPSVSSSASGKIAVAAGLAKIALSDTDLAFALAREFGRLAAAHHRESASAGLAVSLIAGSPLTSAYLATTLLADVVFPMGALAKIGISLLASLGTEQLVEASQQDEADDFALKLMQAAGYDPAALAESRPEAMRGAVAFGWLSTYFSSRAKVAALAQPDPWPDGLPSPMYLATSPEPWPDDAPVLAAFEPWPDLAREERDIQAKRLGPATEALTLTPASEPSLPAIRLARANAVMGTTAKTPGTKKTIPKKPGEKTRQRPGKQQ